MTDIARTLFVEGPSDDRFLTCVFHRLAIDSIAIAQIGGGISNLVNVRPQMLRDVDRGRSIAVLVDADSNIARSRERLHDAIEQHELPIGIDQWFFLPDNQAPGCLETLLEQLAVAQHRAIFDCFEQYRSFVSNLEAISKFP